MHIVLTQYIGESWVHIADMEVENGVSREDALASMGEMIKGTAGGSLYFTTTDGLAVAVDNSCGPIKMNLVE